MSAAPYLFEEMNEPAPRRESRRRRTSPLAPGVRAALAGLRETMSAIPASEWEVRQERWRDLQRMIRKAGPKEPAQEMSRRSQALQPRG